MEDTGCGNFFPLKEEVENSVLDGFVTVGVENTLGGVFVIGAGTGKTAGLVFPGTGSTDIAVGLLNTGG